MGMHGGMLLIPKEQAQAKYTASVFLFNDKNDMEWKYYLFGYEFINRELFVYLAFFIDAFTVIDAVWFCLSF